MTTRHVDISFIGDDKYIISCYDGKHSNPIHQWETNRLECIPVICREWIEFNANEEYLTTILEGIL